MLGKLYVVATPIGNFEDISLRALEVFKEVDCLLTEDTRSANRILMHFNLKIPVISYHQHSGLSKKEKILSLLVGGKNLALITDAGTPGISDPGNELIDYLLTKEPSVKVVPVPGPSSLTCALSICGFNVSKFLFLGFLPKRKKIKIYKMIQELEVPIVYFDSPFRVIKNLQELKSFIGEKRVCVCRELTKIHETIYRGQINEVLDKLVQDKIRGEIVVVIEGK